MDATQLRDRRMNQALDEMVRKEADDFWRESQERRKMEKDEAEKQDVPKRKRQKIVSGSLT